MLAWLTDLYPAVKAAHIISVIAWMAGLFYLPRLFVYHAEATPDSETAATFEVMERRLLGRIMNPAMIATYVFGGALLATLGVVEWDAAWLYLKLALVGVLSWLHHAMAVWHKAFAEHRNRHDARFYRRINEVPTVAMVGIVLFVVIRPF